MPRDRQENLFSLAHKKAVSQGLDFDEFVTDFSKSKLKILFFAER